MKQMNKLLLSALTLGCLSMALLYLSTQELGEPEAVAIQAIERTCKPSAADAKNTSKHQPDPRHSAASEAYPPHFEPKPHVYEI